MYPAGEPGIAVRYVDVDGVRTRVIESGPASGNAVVLIHGWGACVYSWDALIPALAGAGYRAVAFDLPGHGLSDKPVGDAHYTTVALTQFVVSLMRVLDIPRATLAGHSLGAAIALRLALQNPDVVARLVLISPVGLGRAPLVSPLRWLSPRLVDRITPAIMTRSLYRLILRVAYGERRRPSTRDVEQYWAPTQFDEYAWAVRSCAHAFNWEPATAEELDRLLTPVLVIGGDHDRLVFGMVHRARAIPGARIEVVPGGGHVVVQDSSDQVSAEILRYLAVS
jgi:pimeloyl-ACP methyl ester carboxylesterase